MKQIRPASPTISTIIGAYENNAQPHRAEYTIQEIFRAISSEPGEVSLILDISELYDKGEPSRVWRGLRTAIERRTARGYWTNARVLARSIAHSIGPLISEAEAQAIHLHGQLDEKVVEAIFQESVDNNAGTEAGLYDLGGEFENHHVGTFEFRASRSSRDHDYLRIEIEPRDETRSSVGIISKRRPASGPFESPGALLRELTNEALEESEYFQYRWRTAIQNPPPIHCPGFAAEALKRYRDTRYLISIIKEMTAPCSPEIPAMTSIWESYNW